MLVVPGRLDAQPRLRARHHVDRYQVDTAVRREVHTKDIGPTDVRNAPSTVVCGPAVETHASAVGPGGLALDAQERSATEVHDEVIWLATSERHEHVEVPLDERVEDGRFR